MSRKNSNHTKSKKNLNKSNIQRETVGNCWGQLGAAKFCDLLTSDLSTFDAFFTLEKAYPKSRSLVILLKQGFTKFFTFTKGFY